MKTLHTDVAVIGAGTAGLAAYRAARAAGKRALLIEGGPYGTTCARVGCMPSKLLIAAAEAAHAAMHTDAFGVRVEGEVSADGKAVMDRVKRERDRFVGFVLDGVENIPAEDKIRGQARFVSDTVLRVDEHAEIQASRVVIATGSRPSVPPPLRDGRPACRERRCVRLGRSAAPRGRVRPGVIGLELGQALARLGVEVRVFGVSGSLGGISDPLVRQSARKIFQREFYLDPDARVLETRRVGDEVEVRYVALDNSERTERFDYALVATGRRPNVDGLGLEHTSLALNRQGVPLFDRETMQAGDAPIFIAGDANADAPLLHGPPTRAHRRRERRALSRCAPRSAARAAGGGVLGSADRAGRTGPRAAGAGHLRHRPGGFRRPGPLAGDAEEPGHAARVRRYRDWPFPGRRDGRSRRRAHRPPAGVGRAAGADRGADAGDAVLPPRDRGRPAHGVARCRRQAGAGARGAAGGETV